MPFPRKRANWKKYQPRDLRDAFRACKDYGREKRNLSVERIAELMGISADLLYKWLANGEMRAALIPSYEHVCGVHFVTEYLAAGSGRIVIQLPSGKPANAKDLNALQGIINDAIGKLIRCYSGEAEIEETQQGLTITLKAIAWHRENVRHLEAPELDLHENGS